MCALKSPNKPFEPERDLDDKPGRKVDPEAFRRLAGHILRHRRLLVWGFSLILLGTFAALYEPFLFGSAIDRAIRPGDGAKLRLFALAFLGVECVRVGSTIAHNYLFSLLGQRVMQGLRLAVMSHLLRLPIPIYDRVPVGRLVTRVTNDISALAEMFSSGFASIFTNVLVMLGIIIWLFFLDPWLAGISVCVFPILIVVSASLSGKLKVAYREIRARLSALNAFLAENILGMKVVHLFNRQDIHLDKFDRINESYTDAQTASVRVFAYLQPAITWSTGITMALVVSFGATSAYRGELKIGLLLTFA